MHSFSIFVQHMLFPNWIMFECLNPAINHFAVHQSVPKVELLFCAAAVHSRQVLEYKPDNILCFAGDFFTRCRSIVGAFLSHGGTPIAGLFISWKMSSRDDDLGVPLFQETSNVDFCGTEIVRGLEKEADVAHHGRSAAHLSSKMMLSQTCHLQLMRNRAWRC